MNASHWQLIGSGTALFLVGYCLGISTAFGKISREWGKIAKEWDDIRARTSQLALELAHLAEARRQVNAEHSMEHNFASIAKRAGKTHIHIRADGTEDVTSKTGLPDHGEL